jgi:hypothetical protein
VAVAASSGRATSEAAEVAAPLPPVMVGDRPAVESEICSLAAATSRRRGRRGGKRRGGRLPPTSAATSAPTSAQPPGD